MRNESLTFFTELLNTPSPSGAEERAAKVYRDYTSEFADSVTTDVMGNVWARINPDAPRQIMLAGHIDEIGFIVHYVSDEGLVYFMSIGGHDSAIPLGQRVWIHSGKKRIPGVIGRKAIHLLTPDERKQKSELSDLWIDIGARNKKEALGLIEIGDVVTYQYEYQSLANGMATARGFDNKMGAFVVAEALRHLAAKRPDKGVGVIAVGTTQEEVGLRGARTAAQAIGCEAGIAVDVTHAIDYPTVDKKKHGDIRMGEGPVVNTGPNVNPAMFDIAKQAAKAEKISIQVEVDGGVTGTDAGAMQVAGAGMATGLLGVAIRYMHTPVEVLSLKDVEQCAKLMAAMCRLITPKTDFTPRVKK